MKSSYCWNKLDLIPGDFILELLRIKDATELTMQSNFQIACTQYTTTSSGIHSVLDFPNQIKV